MPIQTLRAVAAMMVVVFHFTAYLERLGYSPSVALEWGHKGVDIFFIISGFIMWVSTQRRPNITAREFMINRVIRIVPLYWIVTILMAVGLVMVPGAFTTTVFNGAQIVLSLLFIPHAGGWFMPTLQPGWTLNFEMAFYALFAFAIFLTGDSLRARLATATVLIGGFWLVCDLLGPRIPALAFYARYMMLEFVIGIFLGALFLSDRVKAGWIWYISLGLGFILLANPWGREDLVYLLDPIGAAAIVLGALFAPLPNIPGSQQLGDASYSLYLIHIPIFAFVTVAFRELGLNFLPSWLFVLVAFTAVILGSVLCFRLIEKPISGAISRKRRTIGLTTAPTMR